MHLVLSFMLIFFFSPAAYCQPVKGFKGIGKEEAIELAKNRVPSGNLKVEAVFVTKENQWIIRFSDPFSPEVVAYMLRVEAISRHYPQFLQGSQIERYEPYFKNGGNMKCEPSNKEVSAVCG